LHVSTTSRWRERGYTRIDMSKKKDRPHAKHPVQPLELDKHGVLRFKSNAIVRHLLDHGGISMNDIARLDFSQEDHEQFAQLIGYSHSGSGDLGYMRDETWYAAAEVYEKGVSELEARNAYLREQIREAQAGMREGVATLFGIHEDDLKRSE
jgi:hypothetical protein